MNNCDDSSFLLNEKAALERFGGEEELYEEILTMFISEPQFSLSSVQSKINEGKISDAASLVHRLKGTAGTIGAEMLYDICSKAEHVLRGKTEGNIDLLLKEVSDMYEKTFKVIQQRAKKPE